MAFLFDNHELTTQETHKKWIEKVKLGARISPIKCFNICCTLNCEHSIKDGNQAEKFGDSVNIDPKR